jgi:hypothetical protein
MHTCVFKASVERRSYAGWAPPSSPHVDFLAVVDGFVTVIAATDPTAAR